MIVTAVSLILMQGCAPGAAIAHAQVQGPVVGVSYLAASAFTKGECDKALAVYDNTGSTGVGLAFLWGTFGDSKACVNRFLQRFSGTGREVRLHIYATNETCRRAPRYCETDREVSHWLPAAQYNRAWEQGEVVVKRELIERLREVARYVDAVQARHPDVSITVSTGLEDNFTAPVARAIVRTYQRVLGGKVAIVRNQNTNEARGLAELGGSSRVDAYELHSIESRFQRTRPTKRGAACLWGNDGYDIRFTRELPGGGFTSSNRRGLRNAISESYAEILGARYRESDCEVWLWWNTQGIDESAKRWVAPSERSFRVYRSDVIAARKVLMSIYRSN
jgi:hypothetical protein